MNYSLDYDIEYELLPPTCGNPRFLARMLTLDGSACSIRPYSSQCSLSSAHMYPTQSQTQCAHGIHTVCSAA